MSTTATQFDLKGFLTSTVKEMTDQYNKDLGYIPADKIAVSPMGVARTPADFTCECAGFNRLVAGFLTGVPRPSRTDEESAAHIASIDTIEKAQAELKSSTDALVAALENATDEQLMAEAETPWGMKAPVHSLVHMSAVHIAYHCGQINYIQSLYGDGEGHWH